MSRPAGRPNATTPGSSLLRRSVAGELADAWRRLFRREREPGDPAVEEPAPDVLERVRSDRSLVSEAIEETLRFETSVTIVSRVAAKDASIGGVDVPKGASMMLLTGSANRDEARYDSPDAWDIDRKDKNHLAFGWGRHLCRGMHLARLELASGIDAILDRLPDLRFDPESPVPEIVGFAFRGPESLPVVFRPS